MSGDAEPVPGQLFVVEQVLRVDPGELCALLGYVPVGTPLSVELVIKVSPEIDDDLRPMLLAAAREIIRQSHSAHRPPLRGLPHLGG